MVAIIGRRSHCTGGHLITFVALYEFSDTIQFLHLIPTGEIPTMCDLLLLKYTDSEGTTKSVNIIDDACCKWKDIATMICDSPNKVDEIAQKNNGDPRDCLRDTFKEGFIYNKPTRYSQDWSGLKELLRDVRLEHLADMIDQALSSLKSAAKT